MRINIGCGQTPIKGWVNYDNSFNLRLSKIPLLPEVLHKLRLLDSLQYQFIQFARINEINYGNATDTLPLANESCDVLYSSHMIEHLDRHDAAKFLNEAFRVLRAGGIIRIAAPDIKKQVARYIESGDANAFIELTHMCIDRPRSLVQRIKSLFIGPRHHQWMYDGKSLTALLKKHGFVRVEEVFDGKTRIHEPQPLDLFERAWESTYVEAEKPTA